MCLEIEQKKKIKKIKSDFFCLVCKDKRNIKNLYIYIYIYVNYERERERVIFLYKLSMSKLNIVTHNYYISSFLPIRILGLVGKRIERISHKKLLLIIT